MEKRYDEYRTGQGVPVGGQYQCQSGEKVTFKEGESFPLCPVTGEETTWTHEGR